MASRPYILSSSTTLKMKLDRRILASAPTAGVAAAACSPVFTTTTLRQNYLSSYSRIYNLRCRKATFGGSHCGYANSLSNLYGNVSNKHDARSSSHWSKPNNDKQSTWDEEDSEARCRKIRDEKEVRELMRMLEKDPYDVLFGPREGPGALNPWKMDWRALLGDMMVRPGPTPKQEPDESQARPVARPPSSSTANTSQHTSGSVPAGAEAKDSQPSGTIVENDCIDPITLRRVPRMAAKPVVPSPVAAAKIDAKANGQAANNTFHIPIKRYAPRNMPDLTDEEIEALKSKTGARVCRPVGFGGQPSLIRGSLSAIEPGKTSTTLPINGLAAVSPLGTEKKSLGTEKKVSSDRAKGVGEGHNGDAKWTEKSTGSPAVETATKHLLRVKETKPTEPALVYDPKDDTTEDMDLLRASNVRASAGYGKAHHAEESAEEKQERWRVLEAHARGAEQDREEGLDQEFRADQWALRKSLMAYSGEKDNDSKATRALFENYYNSRRDSVSATFSRLYDDLKRIRRTSVFKDEPTESTGKPDGESLVAPNSIELDKHAGAGKEVSADSPELHEIAADPSPFAEQTDKREGVASTLPLNSIEQRKIEHKIQGQEAHYAAEQQERHAAEQQRHSRIDTTTTEQDPTVEATPKGYDDKVAAKGGDKLDLRDRMSKKPEGADMVDSKGTSPEYLAALEREIVGIRRLVESSRLRLESSKVWRNKQDEPRNLDQASEKRKEEAPTAADQAPRNYHGITGTTQQLSVKRRVPKDEEVAGTSEVYRILAFDGKTETVRIARTTSAVHEALTPKRPAPSILSHLENPTAYFPYMESLEEAGYELVAGNRNMLVYKKIPDVEAPVMSAVESVGESSAGSSAPTDGLVRRQDVEDQPNRRTIPAERQESRDLADAASREQPLFIDARQQEDAATGQEAQPFQADAQPSTASRFQTVRREEPVFSGLPAHERLPTPSEWEQYMRERPDSSTYPASDPSTSSSPGRARRIAKAIFHLVRTGVSVAAIFYAVGLTAEWTKDRKRVRGGGEEEVKARRIEAVEWARQRGGRG